MIRIAICDDDKNVTEEIQSFIMARNENVEGWADMGMLCDRTLLQSILF